MYHEQAVKTGDIFTFTQQRPIIWLIGGSSALGLSIADRLMPRYNMINLSRRKAKENSGSFFNVPIDLSDIAQLRSVIRPLSEYGKPRGVVFAQRYRPSQGNPLVDLQVAMNTEICSSQAIIEEVIKSDVQGTCSIVVVSSVNGSFVSKDIPFWYHWLKSSQSIMVKYYSVQNGGADININCIAVGSFLKDDIASYPPSARDRLEKLAVLSPRKIHSDVNSLAEVVEFYLSDHASIINGQTIIVDGGTTNILQESLL